MKTNKLVSAIQKLTLAETRLIQLAIIEARESGELEEDSPLYVTAESYSKAFNTTKQTAYEALIEAEERLFERRFQFTSERGNPVKSRWITKIEYLKGQYALMINFSSDVINEITQVDGYKQFFTSYRLAQTSDLRSIYSVRLYELLVQWKVAGKTPVFELGLFREQLGLGVNEYSTMSNFKARVLDSAMTEINNKTDLAVEYYQHKKGRAISGFSFSVKLKQNKTYEREKISIKEAIRISQEVIEGGYLGETEEQAIERVMRYKDSDGKSVYWIDTSRDAWIAYRGEENIKRELREKKAEEHKWIVVGNTRVDDDYIDLHIQRGETRSTARTRLIKELRNQSELQLDNDDVPEHVKYMLKTLENRK